MGHQDDQPIIGQVDGNFVPVTVTLQSSTIQMGDPVVLQFNRLLNPGSVDRQTIEILQADGTPFADALFDYDPVLLTVSLSNPNNGGAWIMTGQNYEIVVNAATAATQGVLAIDNATLTKTVQLSVSVMGTGVTGPPEPTMDFCVDVLPIFLAHCSLSSCHGSPSMTGGSPLFPDGGTLPADGLVLDNSQGVALTAIGKVAIESNVGPSAGTTVSPGCLTMPYTSCSFGVDMPVIDPGTNGSGDPGNSWLLYKTLLAVPSTSADDLAQCAPESTYVSKTSPTPTLSSSQQAYERSVLSNYIIGSQMPYPPNPGIPEGMPQVGTLSLAQLERLRLWIKQGAPLETVTMLGPDGGLIDAGTNCSLCQPILEGGAPPPTDAPPSDAVEDAPKDATKD